MLATIASLALMLTPAQEIFVSSVHPHGPERHELRLRQRCGSESIDVVGLGSTRPTNATARISVNGRLLSGAAADTLRADLSNARAVYRIAALCVRGQPGIWLRIHSGEAQPSGEVVYREGSARIVRGRVERYEGLAPSTAGALLVPVMRRGSTMSARPELGRSRCV